MKSLEMHYSDEKVKLLKIEGTLCIIFQLLFKQVIINKRIPIMAYSSSTNRYNVYFLDFKL